MTGGQGILDGTMSASGSGLPSCYIVVPCYNEQDVLPETARRLLAKIEGLVRGGVLSSESCILFCDDGSSDATWEIISELHETNPACLGIRLSHNRGHQNALLAGILHARGRCDFTVSMDADLQDDVEALDSFIARYREGCDIVFGVRRQRSTDTRFKRTTARGFYRLMRLMGTEVVNDHADYRLLSARAMDALAQYPEENLFLRGLACDLGFKTGTVEYDRAERFAGESKYPLRKMVRFAIDGITSFSDRPLVLVSGLGVVIALLSVLGLLHALVSKILGVAVPGWAAIVASIWLLGGIQLLCLGIIGIYVGKVYIEAKRRPRYIISETLL